MLFKKVYSLANLKINSLNMFISILYWNNINIHEIQMLYKKI